MRTTHICLSVRGALNWSKAEMRRMAPGITVNGEKLKTADEVRDALLDELSQGHEVIPLCECDNFDYKKGCLGHDEPDEESGNEVYKHA